MMVSNLILEGFHMGRKYDAALLESLRKGVQRVEKDGVPIMVKPIPEGGADGDMDPRLAKSMRLMPLLSRFMPKPKANATVAEQIAMPRKMFGEYKGDYVVAERGVTVARTDARGTIQEADFTLSLLEYADRVVINNRNAESRPATEKSNRKTTNK